MKATRRPAAVLRGRRLLAHAHADLVMFTDNQDPVNLLALDMKTGEVVASSRCSTICRRAIRLPLKTPPSSMTTARASSAPSYK